MITEATEKTTKIPPIVFQEYPVDVHLRISRKGARYGADIIAEGRLECVPIDMSPQDLVVLNNRLQKEIQAAAGENVNWSQLTNVEIERELRPLAEAGSSAYKKVFSHNARTAIQAALAAAQEKIGNSRAVSIQIASEDFFLPWDLIYPNSLKEPISQSHFWGMKHIISRVIIQDACPGAFVSPIIPISTRPKLGLLTNNDLPSVKTKEIPFFEKLDSDGKIALSKLRALNPDPKELFKNNFVL